MPLNPPNQGLRTIRNGSNGVAKANIAVAAGDELTVPADVAAQLLSQASGAFKADAAEAIGVPLEIKPAAKKRK